MSSRLLQVKVISQIRIRSNKQLIFKYLSDLKYHFLWNPHLQDVKPVVKLKLNTVYKSSSLLLGVKVNGVNRVTKIIKDKVIAIENKTGTIKYSVEYEINPVSDEISIVKCITQVHLSNRYFMITKPVLKLLTKRELQSDLKALKIVIENEILA